LCRASGIGAGESRRFIRAKKPKRPFADCNSVQGADLRVTTQKQAKKQIKSRPTFPQRRQECVAAGLVRAYLNPHITGVIWMVLSQMMLNLSS
jgi:hypothetical protein